LIFWFRKEARGHFFSETTWIIETKLPMNDHWKVLLVEETGVSRENH
jgi:hypothetical protein